MKKILLFILCLIEISSSSFAQNSKMDSLSIAFNKATQDTMRLKISLSLCEACEIKDNLMYAVTAVQLADKLLSKTANYKEKRKIFKRKADANNYMIAYYSYFKNDSAKVREYMQKRLAIYMANKDAENIVGTLKKFSTYYIEMGNYPKGIEYIDMALSVAKEMNYKKGVAGCLVQIGGIYKDQGEHTQALENYQQAFLLYNELKDTIGLAGLFLSEGGIYSLLHNINKALECYKRSISFYEIKREKRGVRLVFSCIGHMYLQNNKLTEALVSFEKCMSMSEEMNDNYWIGITSGNIAGIYSQQGYYYKALANNSKALKIFKVLKEDGQIGNSYRRLANTYFELKDYNKAKTYIDSTIEIEKRNQFLGNLKQSEILATEIDSARGDNKGAFEHYKEYIILSNKLKSEDIKKAAVKERYQNEYDKQKVIDKAIADGEIEKQKTLRNGFIFGFIVVLLFAGVFFSQRNKIKKGKKLSDELLLNILPAEVAEELKSKGSADAKQFDMVTVLFTDFKDFTQISETMTPTELVGELNTFFKAFDNIITRLNIEKIKTIGDSYMCVGGLPFPSDSHAESVLNAGLEIQKFVEQHSEERLSMGLIPMQIRIGIHSGPVVAGIVGLKKYAYDIWGDTVNTASRMESSGEAGKVNISSSTYELIKDKFICTPRGKVIAKHKGDMEMYFVERRD